MELDLLSLSFLWVTVIAAAVLRAFTGFGFALAAVPVFALVLSPVEAVVLSACLATALGLQTLPQYAGDLSIKPLWPLYLGAFLGTAVGARLLQSMSEETFRLAIGLMTIMASLVLARFAPRSRHYGAATRAAVGVCSGVLNGAFAVPGPPVIAYAMATEPDPARSRALMLAFFAFSALVGLGNYAAAGWVVWSSLLLFLLTYPAMLAGNWLGYWLFQRYAGRFYRRVAVLTLLLIGVSISLRSLLG
jgi:uncharacterized membrane protein YfcA